MPRYDGTGPFGDGRPGRGLGPCGRFAVSSRGVFGPRLGRGYGRGFGRGLGLGWRRGYGYHPNRWYDEPETGYPTPDAMYSFTKDELLAQKEELEKQMEWVDRLLTGGKESK